MRTAFKVIVIVLVLLAVVLFIPVFPQSTSKNYIITSGSATVYESIGLQMINCGGYYYSTSGSNLGQSQSSSGYGVHCNPGSSS